MFETEWNLNYTYAFQTSTYAFQKKNSFAMCPLEIFSKLISIHDSKLASILFSCHISVYSIKCHIIWQKNYLDFLINLLLYSYMYIVRYTRG